MLLASGPCNADAVAKHAVTPESLPALVDHMFELVLDEAERRELLTWIQAWEAENPDVDAAHRVTGWIDVAYAFQARADRKSAPAHVARLRPQHSLPWNPGSWSVVASTA